MPLNLDDEYTVKTPWLTEAARKVGEACGSAITYTVKTASQVRDKWSDAAEQVQDRAERMKAEQPLAILGVIAGIAVSAGVLTRVWRSNRYE